MKHEVKVRSPLSRTFAEQKLRGMFDLEDRPREELSFTAEVPGLEEPWSIGAIVGPSGSGKTTIARRVFGSALYEGSAWRHDSSVIEQLGEDVSSSAECLTSVGFGSPPAWLRPYGVLSNGEQFRADLARALLNRRDLVVYDEFTSVVDRTVARFSSAAVAKTIRRTGRRFVAISCHYDFLEWLEPDWVTDMQTGDCSWGSLRRGAVRLDVWRAPRTMWGLFAHHHYLSPELPKTSKSYIAAYEGRPVAFCAIAQMTGRRSRLRICRVVTLPDYQGLGIGRRLADAVSRHYHDEGKRVSITTSHPSMIAGLLKNNCWDLTKIFNQERTHRKVVSFEYVGESHDPLP